MGKELQVQAEVDLEMGKEMPVQEEVDLGMGKEIQVQEEVDLGMGKEIQVPVEVDLEIPAQEERGLEMDKDKEMLAREEGASKEACKDLVETMTASKEAEEMDSWVAVDLTDQAMASKGAGVQEVLAVLEALAMREGEAVVCLVVWEVQKAMMVALEAVAMREGAEAVKAMTPAFRKAMAFKEDREAQEVTPMAFKEALALASREVWVAK